MTFRVSVGFMHRCSRGLCTEKAPLLGIIKYFTSGGCTRGAGGGHQWVVGVAE